MPPIPYPIRRPALGFREKRHVRRHIALNRETRDYEAARRCHAFTCVIPVEPFAPHGADSILAAALYLLRVATARKAA
jgi:hypothetical protein